MFKGIIHLHTLYSSDSTISPRDLIHFALKEKLNFLAITEHNHMDSFLTLEKLRDKIYPSLILIPAEEIATQDGEVIGLFLSQSIVPYQSFSKTVELIHQQKGLVLIPHPFDSFRKERIKSVDVLDLHREHIDIIEIFNSRSILKKDHRYAKQYALKHHKLMTYGADAHFDYELKNCIVQMEPFVCEVDSFLSSLKKGMVPLTKKTSYFGSFHSFLRKKIKLIK